MHLKYKQTIDRIYQGCGSDVYVGTCSKFAQSQLTEKNVSLQLELLSGMNMLQKDAVLSWLTRDAIMI